MAYLAIEKGAPSRRLELGKERLVIGRDAECDLVLDTDLVSRAHARLIRQDSAWRIEDLKSRNGTFLNGLRISAPTALADGDRIGLSADVVLSFHADVEAAPPAAAKERPVSSTIFATREMLEGVRTEARPEAKLRAVLEISRNCGALLKQDELLPKILDSLFRIFVQADHGFILLRDEASEELVPKAVKNRGGTDLSAPVSHTIVQKAMETGKAILSADALSDAALDMSRSMVALQIRSILCVPLLPQEGPALGVIQLHTQDAKRAFTADDLEVLIGMANTASLALENARMHESLLARERMAREMELAKEVQRGFLPSRFPTVPGYEFHACYEPASSVGGDYYGFVELPDQRLAITLGDVSGKGMPAALLMARLSSDIRFAALTERDPGSAVTSVNRSIGEAAMSDRFVTLLYMVIDLKSHTLWVVNAGHMPPIIRRSGGAIEELGEDVAGLPLNVSPDPDCRFEAAVTKLGPGDLVVAYTDGVSEAASPSGELFGIARLRSIVSGSRSPQAAVTEAVSAAHAFAAGGRQGDDITLLCFARQGTGV
jgi:serine phosphatase RsbU (regulator of sigma subunit)/pSer/pThr/pTyr-binding forkhead associated (FHA) protein